MHSPGGCHTKARAAGLWGLFWSHREVHRAHSGAAAGGVASSLVNLWKGQVQANRCYPTAGWAFQERDPPGQGKALATPRLTGLLSPRLPRGTLSTAGPGRKFRALKAKHKTPPATDGETHGTKTPGCSQREHQDGQGVWTGGKGHCPAQLETLKTGMVLPPWTQQPAHCWGEGGVGCPRWNGPPTLRVSVEHPKTGSASDAAGGCRQHELDPESGQPGPASPPANPDIGEVEKF